MSENTFAGKSASSVMGLSHMKRGEFFETRTSIFDSEDMIDAIYNIYIPLAAKGFSGFGNRREIARIGSAYIEGFYVPCELRAVLSGQVDTTNDELINACGCFVPHHKASFFIGLKKVDRLPNGFGAPMNLAIYAVTILYEEDKVDRISKKLIGGVPLSSVTGYVYISMNGDVRPCNKLDRLESGNPALWNVLLCQMAAYCLNINNDSRHIWVVEVAEDIFGSGIYTKLSFGVSSERIKSLFYARQSPFTEDGRRRPILHWVRAHQRRIRDGIDIDINKHLRGINKFEMGGFSFSITNPHKAIKEKKKEGRQ